MTSKQKTDSEALAILVDRVRRSLMIRLQNKFLKAGYGITSEQWMLLHLLWGRDGQSQQQLANTLGKSKSSIVPMIDRLEKKNIVVRIPDKIDGRQKLIFLTKKGRALEEELEPLNHENLNRLQKNILPEGLKKCREVLQQMCENLKNLS
jgi:DNA-binding MarR family transcriptional regulator